MRKTALVVAIPMTGAFAVAFALVLLTILSVVGPIFESVTPTGPNGVTKDVIEFGAAHTLFAVAGMLSLPAAIALALFVGGGGRQSRKPDVRRRGPY